MTRGARAARGTAVAVFATFVASLAHTLGGGAPPAPIALMVALAFSVPLAMALTGARARLVRTAVSAVVAQAALHLTYAIGAAPASVDVSTAHAGHSHGAMQLATTSATSVDHGNAWMPVAHLVAAALTLGALVLGDRVVVAVGRAVRVFVSRLTSIPRVDAPSFRIPTSFAEASPFVSRVAVALGSRGPPVEAAAA
jgi:uncharacterized RDD family membrane protein YckC